MPIADVFFVIIISHYAKQRIKGNVTGYDRSVAAGARIG
jgi:hypothetical protein